LGKINPKPLTGVDWLVLVLAGVLTVSTFTHDWRVSQKGDISPFWRLTFAYLMPIVLYWIARQSTISERGVWWLNAALAGFGIYLAITGLAEISGQWWLVFPQYIADPKIGIHFGRARGPMVQAACYGTSVGICLLGAWIWRPKLSRPAQLLLLATMPLFAAAIYFSYTRSAWLATGLGLMVVTGLMLPSRWRLPVLGGVAACGLLVAATRWESILGFQREQSAGETRKSVDMRGSFAYASWLMFQDRPLWGCGFGQYRREVLPYLSDRSSDLDLESIRGYVHHNTLLCLLVENGLIGTLLFVGVLIGLARRAWRLHRNIDSPPWVKSQAALLLGVIVAYTVQMLSHDVTYTSIENMLLFFLAGVTMALISSPLRSNKKAAPSHRATGRPELLELSVS
jgi:O-antigen ligase